MVLVCCPTLVGFMHCVSVTPLKSEDVLTGSPVP